MDDDEPVENEETFWDELDDIVSTPCRTLERIDDTLRTWISFIGTNRESFVNTEQDVLHCSYALWSSDLFEKNADYIRRQIVYALLQEEDPPTLHLVLALLFLDGRKHDATFELMNAEGAFPRLVQLIKDDVDDDRGMHRQLLELLYEMSRIQQVSWSNLTSIDDDFILSLFRIIEDHASDASDPYHYPVIRVLLVLNEQYMVSAHNPHIPTSPSTITNRIIKALSLHGHIYKTFGENLILLLNRESETSLQLLILKLLYLLFTTESTVEYFYTNDLHVLVDILMRNLLDLPPPTLSPTSPTSNGDNKPLADRTSSLRHTYLRVLHPLLANTQLRHPPHYKRDELRRMLSALANAGGAGMHHFERPDETTVRLVGRCGNVEWLREDLQPPPTAHDTSNGVNSSDGVNEALDQAANEVRTSSPDDSPIDGRGHAVVAKKQVGLSMPRAGESHVSLQEVARQQERPGVLAPSRRRREEERGAEESPFGD